MNDSAFHDYVRHFVREAVKHADSSPQNALRWITSQITTANLAIFTSNARQKTDAALMVQSHFQALAASPAAGSAPTALDAAAITIEISRNWSQGRFLAALAMAKALRRAGQNPRQHLSQAKSHLADLRELGHPSIHFLERKLSELD
jgi:hypothetical protein